MSKCPHCSKEVSGYGYGDYCSFDCMMDAVRKCPVCFGPFTRNTGHGYHYCSSECQTVDYRKKFYSPKYCAICNKELPHDHPLTRYYDAGVFYACSSECERKYFFDNPPNIQAWKS
ncbi:hypothetical protein OCC47_16355 [Bacillus cereus]|nr:hypothetical protein [Bacillus cereus]